MTDVLVVGAGVAGALLAARLASSGAKVTLLEAGSTMDRAKGVQAYLKSPMKVPESAYAPLPWSSRPDTANRSAYYVQTGPHLFKSTYERRVGGTTWHWLGTSLRLLPSDFQLHSRYGVAIDWPIRYDDLEAWYGQAENELGVAGDSATDLGSPRTTPYPMPKIPQTTVDLAVSKAAQTLGLRVTSTPQARNSVDFQGRPQCCGNAMCIPICPIGAKYDATVHVAAAQRAGAELLTESVAFRVEVDASGNVSGIRYKKPDGSEHTAMARVYVIAAHGIETPRLLLMSATDALKGGVANSSDQVGRNLCDHPIQLSWGLAHDPVWPYRSPLSTSGIESLRDGPFRRDRGAFRVEIGNDGWDWIGEDPNGLVSVLLKQGLTGLELRDRINEMTKRQLRLASLVEQLPQAQNRVTLADEKDALGLPRPRVHDEVDAYTQNGLTAAKALHDRLFKALRATDCGHGETFEGAGHIMGTCRMGSDPRTSVTDPQCRSHDHKNLFILGSSVFCTTGAAVSTREVREAGKKGKASPRSDPTQGWARAHCQACKEHP